MTKAKNSISANGIEIRINIVNDNDYISLTDIAKKNNPDFPADVVKNWLRTRSTIEFLGLWEQINNTDFKLVEFDQFRAQAGTNSFVLTPQKWIEKTNAIGIVSKSGRYGGTYAHKDIALEFASWISPEFKLYIIKDYQRLKEGESKTKAIGWNVKRELAKTNYRIHTEAIKENLVLPHLTEKQKSYLYASEADMINIALFGVTAKQWREDNPEAQGNIRDNATIEQLVILANLETMNAEYIREGLSQQERLVRLNQIALFQLEALMKNQPKSLERIKRIEQ
ncbi:MAG: KilA-N domain-containing protein [Phascolarctobacterium sp.]|nr:KilA-N domain-containing protein [Phascolarctobacterium sp.]